jgi:hypothetical protein
VQVAVTGFAGLKAQLLHVQETGGLAPRAYSSRWKVRKPTMSHLSLQSASPKHQISTLPISQALPLRGCEHNDMFPSQANNAMEGQPVLIPAVPLRRPLCSTCTSTSASASMTSADGLLFGHAIRHFLQLCQCLVACHVVC